MNNCDDFNYTDGMRRSDYTMIRVKRGIRDLIAKHTSGSDLLEIGVNHGTQTVIYHSQFNSPGNLVGYDWSDFRHESVRDKIQFERVDIETERFPADGESFDVVVCNQVLEHIKNIYTPLSEMWRVLRVGGMLVLSVPNLSCWHNCLLLSIGRQPTTIQIHGSHVRGYAIWDMTKFLLHDGLFVLKELHGYGIPPLFKARAYGPLRTYCHTPVWALVKNKSEGQTWENRRRNTFTTTSFFQG